MNDDDVRLPVKFHSQTGVLVVLWNGIALAYKLDTVWYAGMYRPAGFLRRPVAAAEAIEMLESLPLTDIEEALK